MSRPIPAWIRAALYGQETSGVVTALLEITHGVSGYTNPLRICNNSVYLSYMGNTYLAFPFKFDPPDQKTDGSIANARLTICAVDQQIAGILRQTETPPTVRAIATFWSDETGSVQFEEIASWPLTLRNVSGDSMTIQGELVYEDRLDNQVPAGEFRPSLFPGLF